MRFRRVPGLGAAAALSVVTLVTFAIFQNYGPESAVRQFHRAILTNDEAAIAEVVTGPPDASSLQQIRSLIGGILANSPNYRIVTSDRTSERVEMLALYENGRRPVVWVVVKEPGQDHWRISPFLTMQGLLRLGY